MPNGVDDFEGYMFFVEPIDAAGWWSPVGLKALHFTEGQNPYDLPNDHIATALQCIAKAAKE